MDMRVKQQVMIPTVQYAERADLRPEIRRWDDGAMTPQRRRIYLKAL